MRLIDADALIAKLEDDAKYMEDNIAIMFTYAAINDIKREPTVDATEVVRCGECKHMTAKGNCIEFADGCLRPSASDFCSYGERKDG